MNFFGNIDAKVDNKGRCFIPSQFRKTLLQNDVTRIVLRKDLFEPCLSVYPYEAWIQEFSELKAKLSPWNPKHQQILRHYALNLETADLDANGRILIPKRYLDEARIQNEIRFIGIDSKIEIWSREVLEQNTLLPNDFIDSLQNI